MFKEAKKIIRAILFLSCGVTSVPEKKQLSSHSKLIRTSEIATGHYSFVFYDKCVSHRCGFIVFLRASANPHGQIPKSSRSSTVGKSVASYLQRMR